MSDLPISTDIPLTVSSEFGCASFRFTCCPSSKDTKWLKKQETNNGEFVYKFLIIMIPTDQAKKHLMTFIEQHDARADRGEAFVCEFIYPCQRDEVKEHNIKTLGMRGEVYV